MSAVKQAHEVLTRASEKDINRDYEGAYLLYCEGDTLLRKAVAEVGAEKVGSVIEEKRQEFLARKNILGEFLRVNKEEGEKQADVDSGGMRQRKPNNPET